MSANKQPLFRIGDIVKGLATYHYWIVIDTRGDKIAFGEIYRPEYLGFGATEHARKYAVVIARNWHRQTSARIIGRIADEHIALIHLGRPDLIPEYHPEVKPSNPDFSLLS